MLVGNDGYFTLIRALNPKLAFDQFVFPADTQAGTRMTVFTSDTLVVNSRSSNLPAARAFVDFIARQKQNTLLCKVVGCVAAYDYARVLNPNIGAKGLDADHAAFAPYVGKIVIAGSTTWPSTAPLIAMGQVAQGLLTGQKTVDDVLKAADDAWPK
jgi:raffinose/stachyose/melibiose transport system substrate-binding protein